MTEAKWVLSPQHLSLYIRAVKGAVIQYLVGHFTELYYLLHACCSLPLPRVHIQGYREVGVEKVIKHDFARKHIPLLGAI